MTDVRYPDVEIQLTGEGGNGFLIVGKVASALRRAGVTDVVEFTTEATAGDYDHLLQTVMAWVEVA
jgi:hypothetical protein